MRKQDLMASIDAELKRCRHNATLSGKLTCKSDFESDLFESEFQFAKDLAFDGLEQDFSDLVAQFGKPYQFGRGGRTVIFEKLTSGGFPWRIQRAIDVTERMSPLEARRFLKRLREFNEHVMQWCKTMPDSVLEYVREENADAIRKNASKKRVTRMVVSYE